MSPLAEVIWLNGQLTPWAAAKVHALLHALHYGTSVFEGVRCYAGAAGPQVFRLDDHLRRLHESARIYDFPMPYGEAALAEACLATLRANRLEEAYLRPIVLLGECGLAVSPLPRELNVDVTIAAFPWGAYLGDAAGVDVCVSSWARLAPNTAPAGARVGGNYLSSYLIGREARLRGLAEGTGLGVDGRPSEGASENLPGGGRAAVHAAGCGLDPDGDHPGHGPGAGAGHRAGGGRAGPAALGALSGRGDLPHRHGRGDHAGPLGGRPVLTGGAPGPVTRTLQAVFSNLVTGRSEDRQG